MLKRIFPMPLHTLILIGVWMLLNEFTMGHLVLGLVLATIIPWVTAPLSNPHHRIKKPIKAFLYIIMVLADIVVSNFEVAGRILRPNRQLRPGLIALPLDLTGQFPLAVLASTISLTPGTVSLDFSEDMKWLYIHALHMDDEQSLIQRIKSRYETPLKEIFAC
ncbi:Na+/H+ antiporter subunit E [Ketobacter sp. MCCC 1A13808]|uniref:Na+/H+ antiporter subunit E n=1 Tax=Ketobacter sp. MCCC 1A13808 TaxID=2602738 RepID=UPI000F289855|nr:Na+/H+ antiporter subunit E [Ketobacter sp. MCCC 1A13808]MVF11626.1 Na+/H+ antiporter subunit E [Ketobacter sp. MCCC 1A13808]RLP55242.1 MAG: Na+/H+ antiporter subunit E [Ketobacter sp.]